MYAHHSIKQHIIYKQLREIIAIFPNIYFRQ